MRQFASGTVTGTGAAVTVNLGWLPDFIKVTNVTDGDQIDEWYAGMADGTSIQINTAVAPRTTNGISLFIGDTTLAKGFTIGSGISEATKVLAYTAWRV